MTLSQTTKSLISEINAASGNTLQRSMDLGALLETAHQNSLHDILNDLAFSAKFLIKSFDLMKKVGKGGEGYDKLESEFTSQIKKSHALISQLLEKSDAMTKAHFTGTYLSMDTIAMQNLMQLFHDLSWYKNYLIDKR
ncbi:MAG: hypothetical protein HYV29_05900 [Ignavibacteriales bacterium]|nr:hypothetical protein [Ignavibacteriales bacterium]